MLEERVKEIALEATKLPFSSLLIVNGALIALSLESSIASEDK